MGACSGNGPIATPYPARVRNALTLLAMRTGTGGVRSLPSFATATAITLLWTTRWTDWMSAAGSQRRGLYPPQMCRRHPPALQWARQNSSRRDGIGHR